MKICVLILVFSLLLIAYAPPYAHYVAVQPVYYVPLIPFSPFRTGMSSASILMINCKDAMDTPLLIYDNFKIIYNYIIVKKYNNRHRICAVSEIIFP